MPAGQLAKGVDYVLLAGGMTMMPAIFERLQEVFPSAKLERALNAVGTPDAEAAMTRVVRGLSTDRAYDSWSLSRRGYDSVLEWEDKFGVRHEEALYEAFTPLYSGTDVRAERPLQTVKKIRIGDVRGGKGVLSFRTTDGQTLRIKGDDVTDGKYIKALIDVLRSVELEIRADGYVIFRSGDGTPIAFEVDAWPVVGSRDSAPIELKARKGMRPPVIWEYPFPAN